MRQRDEEGQRAEMPAVREQRQEAPVEPRQGPDRQDEAQQEEGAGAGGADAQHFPADRTFGRGEPQAAGEHEDEDVEGDERDQHGARARAARARPRRAAAERATRLSPWPGATAPA